MNAGHSLKLLGGALLLAGCAQQAEQPRTAGAVSGLQVAIGECIAPTSTVSIKSGEKELGTVLATALISQGVNMLGRAATAAGASKTWTVQGARNFQATSGSFPKCLQVVRGRFLTEGPAAATWTLPKESGWPADTQRQLDARGLNSVDVPDFLFEGQIVPSQDLAAFAIRPARATYMTPIDSRFLRPGKDRNIALFFAITAPGTKPTLDTNPAATVVLGELQPSTTRRYRIDAPLTSPYESPWFTLSRQDALKPLTVSVLMSETQGEQAFLTFMGSLLSDPKVVAAANAELGSQLIPSVREANESAAEAKAATDKDDLDIKLQEALTKLTTCSTGSDYGATLQAASGARQSLRSYLRAAQKAEAGAPSGAISASVIETIDLRASLAGLKKACKNVLDGMHIPD